MKFSIKLILVGFGLLLNGCDSSDSEQSNNPPSGKEKYELVLNQREVLPVGFSATPSAQLISTTTGTSQDVSDEVSLKSSEPSVALLSGRTVQAQSLGETTLTATLNKAGVDYSTTSRLKVTDALVDTLTIHAPNATLGIGATQQDTAIAKFDDGSSLEVTRQPNSSWTVTPNDKASIVSTTGRLTAISPGEVSVELIGQANGLSFSGSKSLTITAATVEALSVTPSGVRLKQGMTQQYTATATYSDKTTNDVTTLVTWSVDSPQLASIDSDTGVLTAGSKTGLVVITATFTVSNKTFSQSVSALIDNKTPISSLSITPNSTSFPVLSDHKLSAIARDELGESYDVSSYATWSIDDSSYASINAQGLLQIKDRIKNKPINITATFEGKNATISGLLTTSPVERFFLSPQKIILSKGFSKQLSTTIVFENNSTLDFASHSSLTWSTKDKTIATVVDGLVTAHTSGITQLEVAGSYQGQTFSSSAEIEVTPSVVKNISVTPENHLLFKGQSQQFNATAFLSDLTEVDITDAPNISWSSSNNARADVNTKGIVTAKAPGVVKVTATLNGIQETATLYIADNENLDVASAKIVPAGPSNLPLGTQRNYSLELTNSQGTKNLLRSASTFTYVSSDPTIASIDAKSGLLTTKQVGGPVTISLNGNIAGVQAADASLNVSNAILQDLELTPENTQTRLATPVSLTITKTYSDGSKADSLTNLTWKNSNPIVGSIDPSTATFTPLGIGSTTLSVASKTMPGLISESQIEVLEASLESFKIDLIDKTPPRVNQAKAMRATGTWTDGSTRDITYFVDWSVSSANNIATISKKGVLTATAIGKLTILAQLDGVQDQQLETIAKTDTTSLSVPNSDLTLSLTESTPLIVHNQNGQVISDIVSYSSSDEDTVTVTNTGTVTALKTGNAEITVTLDNLSTIVIVNVPTSLTSCGPINSKANDTDGACLKVTSTNDNQLLFTAMPSKKAIDKLGLQIDHLTQRLSVNSPREGVAFPNEYIGFKGKNQLNSATSYCAYLKKVRFLNLRNWRLPTQNELTRLLTEKGPLGTNYRWPYPKGRGYRVSELTGKTYSIQWGNLLNEGDQNAAPTSCVAMP